MAGMFRRKGILPSNIHIIEDCSDGGGKDKNISLREENELDSSKKTEDVGCVVCGEDDDHANLLICERCDSEYHTYCLDPPLRSVPEGDFYCEKCKPFVLGKSLQQQTDSTSDSIALRNYDISLDDGLDEMVNALPPQFTSRFGEVLWAAGGVGFGWWPSFVFDPRLTVGTARSLAKKNLGKKHLVYFFECNDAPFTVLTCSKLLRWEEGLLQEQDLGRTAKSMGKARAQAFEKAFHYAKSEVEKPIDMRMEWNHHSKLHSIHSGKRDCRDDDSISSRAKKSRSNKKSPTNAIIPNSSKKNELPASSIETPVITTQTKNTRRHRATISKTSALINNDVSSFEEAEALAKALNESAREAKEQEQHNKLKDKNEASTLLFCQICILKDDSTYNNSFIDTANAVNSITAPVIEPSHQYPSILVVGFISLSSKSNFADARRVMNIELDDDGTLPNKWKFYAPQLGPISRKQEEKLLLFDFLTLHTNDGSKLSPLKLLIQALSSSLFSDITTNTVTTASRNNLMLHSATQTEVVDNNNASTQTEIDDNA